MRVGDFAKKLISHDAHLAESAMLLKAARGRDLVAHHGHRIDSDQLWRTIETSFPELNQWLSKSGH